MPQIVKDATSDAAKTGICCETKLSVMSYHDFLLKFDPRCKELQGEKRWRKLGSLFKGLGVMESHEDSNLGESLTRQKSHMNPLAGRAHNETGLTGQRSHVKPLAMPEVAKAMDVSEEPCGPPTSVSQHDHEEPSGPPPAAAHSTREKFQAAPPCLSDPVTTWANQNLRAKHSSWISKHRPSVGFPLQKAVRMHHVCTTSD